ncbi:SUKH-3 domain-containing protein [Kitasatospora sp. P5_F3]
MDLEDLCRQYTEDGYEITSRLREFLAAYGELSVAWPFRDSGVEITTSTERTLEGTHATPRNIRIYAQRLGQGVALVGVAFSTEDCVLLAENGDILLAGDAGLQRVGNSFESAVQALVTGNWDKTSF